MDIISLAAIGGVAFWAYSNYSRNKKKLAAVKADVDHLYKHLNIPKPTPTDET